MNITRPGKLVRLHMVCLNQFLLGVKYEVIEVSKTKRDSAALTYILNMLII